MFSNRLHWDLQQNPLTRLLNQKRASGEAILDLTESNPTRAQLDYPAEEIRAALDDMRSLCYEPTPAGSIEARAAVCDYYSGRVTPDRILLTASTSEAYGFLFKLLADPGDEVLVPRPSYPLFDFLAALESVRVLQYPLVYEHGWSIDLDALRTLASKKTRAIVLVNPNNPTGSFVKRTELDQLVAFCAARNLVLISDEVFADYTFGDDPRRVSSLVDVREVVAFSLSGLSKVAGLPQMKLGWIVASGPKTSRATALANLELVADTYLSVSTPAQNAAGRLLALRHQIQEQIQRRVRQNLAFVRERMAGSPFRVLEVEGGWYATIQVPRIRSEEEWVLHLLQEHNVLVQPGFFFDFESEAFLVVSLLTPPASFQKAIAGTAFSPVIEPRA